MNPVAHALADAEAEIVRLKAAMLEMEEARTELVAAFRSVSGRSVEKSERIQSLEAALLRLGLSWEDADVHPRCGADEGCKSCDEAWEAYSLVLTPQEPTGHTHTALCLGRTDWPDCLIKPSVQEPWLGYWCLKCRGSGQVDDMDHRTLVLVPCSCTEVLRNPSRASIAAWDAYKAASRKATLKPVEQPEKRGS